MILHYSMAMLYGLTKKYFNNSRLVEWYNFLMMLLGVTRIKKTKQTKSGSGTDEIYFSKWPYFNGLKFLIPFLSGSSTQSNLVNNLLYLIHLKLQYSNCNMSVLP